MTWWLILVIACKGGDGKDGEGGGDDSGSDTGEEVFPPSLDWGDCQVVAEPGPLDPYDSQMVFAPSVIGPDMFYAIKGVDGLQRIAAARIDKKGAWVDNAVVLSGADIGTDEVSSPSLLPTKTGMMMYFDAVTEAGPALWRCRLGEVLEECESFLEPGAAGDLDAAGAQSPYVLEMDGGLRLWYVGLDIKGVRRVLTSWSDDGETWSEPGLAVDIGFQGEFDTTSVYSPYVWNDGQGFRMLYSGRSPQGDYQAKRLIETWSEDGVHWVRPVMTLDVSCAGEADAWRVDAPWVVPSEDGWLLFYDGFDEPITENGTRRILMAATVPPEEKVP